MWGRATEELCRISRIEAYTDIDASLKENVERRHFRGVVGVVERAGGRAGHALVHLRAAGRANSARMLCRWQAEWGAAR